jgi:O-antigen ligase
VAVMASFLVMSVLTIIFYREEIFSFARISASISRNENYISPLSLSYSGAMAIGVGSLYLVANRVRLKFLIFLLATIVLSLVPFYLGASRGSIFAIVVPAIVFAIFSRGGRFKGWLIVSLFALAGAFYAAASYMGSAVFDRFMGISEAIETGSSSAARLDMWAAGLEQFAESPLFGSSLQLDLYNAYPHNIIIEALISTGLLGTVPFLMFIFACLYRSFLVARYEPQLFWIPAIFIQGLVQNMFSGAIYFASWMAVGAGLLLSLGPIRSPRRLVGSEPFSYRPQPVRPIHGAGYVSEWDGRGSRASEV